MLFSIHCMDLPGKLDQRMAHYPAHREHLNNATITIVLAGPIAAEDAETPIGSVFVIDAPDLAAAMAFNRADPFFRSGVWDESRIHIHPFLKRRGWLAEF